MPTKNPAAVALGSLGGQKTKAKGSKYFSDMRNKALKDKKKKTVDKSENSDG